MYRQEFHEFFDVAGPIILPVVHVVDAAQIQRNVEVALDEGAPGVFLINHDFGYSEFLPLIARARERFPDYWIGVNFLGIPGGQAFPVLADLAVRGVRVDAYWADDARIDESAPADSQVEAHEIDRIRAAGEWKGLYFGGTAFKKQRPVEVAKYRIAAELACRHMDVVTTSGVATGQPVDHSKIGAFRDGCGDTALAVASGITPENADGYGAAVDCFLVATGINKDNDFYNIDPAKLRRLKAVSGRIGERNDQNR